MNIFLSETSDSALLIIEIDIFDSLEGLLMLQGDFIRINAMNIQILLGLINFLNQFKFKTTADRMSNNTRPLTKLKMYC